MDRRLKRKLAAFAKIQARKPQYMMPRIEPRLVKLPEAGSELDRVLMNIENKL